MKCFKVNAPGTLWGILKKAGWACLAAALAVTVPLPISLGGADKVDPVYAAGLSDIKNHWAEQYITEAVDKGFVSGYPDGTYKPDASISRAELVSLFNRMLGNTGTTSITLSDIPKGEWYYDGVTKAVAAGYVSGYTDNTFKPSNPVTREEAAVMISRFIPTASSPKKSTGAYLDSPKISDWAKEALSRIGGKGYMGAYDDGLVHPQDKLTRAQAAKIICDIYQNETIIPSDPVVRQSGTILENAIYSNTVTIDADLKSGSAQLNNCVVLGTLNVYGGGSDTVTINNSRVINAYVSRSDDKVRLLADGETNIVNVTVDKDCTLQTSSITGDSYGTGMSNVYIDDSAVVIMKGTFPEVAIDGVSVNITLESGTIKNLKVTSSGKNAKVTLGSNSTVETATVDAQSSFFGTGDIHQMYVNANGVSYEKKPGTVKLASGIDDPEGKDSSIDGVTLDPKSKATDVATDTKITIKFDNKIYKYNGKTISDSELEDIITIRSKSETGSKVKFDATVSSGQKLITITPDDPLDTNTRYYVIIPKNSFRYSDDEPNKEIVYYFNTGSTSSKFTTAYSPKNGATGVALKPTIKITFSEAVVRYDDKKTVSSSYLVDEVITFKENSTSKNIGFSASIDSRKKVITITPSESLSEGTVYYLGVNTKSLKTSEDGSPVGASSVKWTTVNSNALKVSSLTASDTNTNSLVLKGTGNQTGTLYVSVSPNQSSPTAAQVKGGTVAGQVGSLTKSVSANTSTTIGTVSGLTPNTKYYIYAVLVSGSNTSAVYATSVSTSGISNGASLKSLSVKGGSTEYINNFNANTYVYKVDVPLGTDQLTIDAKPQDSRGTVSYSPGQTVKLTEAAAGKTQTITATCTVDNASLKYTINVEMHGDTTIKDLSIDGFSTNRNGDTFSTNINVPKETVKVDVSTADPNALVTFDGYKNNTLDLKAGENTFKIEVKSINETKTYYLKITTPVSTKESPAVPAME